MELVPIITQILAIVASLFIVVLLISFIASKLKKKENTAMNNKNGIVRNRAQTSFAEGYNSNKSIYYGANSYQGGSINYPYPKEIKVVKRSGVSKEASSNRYRTKTSQRNNRFTVVNNISNDNNKPTIETDEYGFKVYADHDLTRSFYLPN